MKKKVSHLPEEFSTKRVQQIFSRIRSLEAKRVNIINFAFGMPGFETPEVIREAALEAMKMGPGKPASYDGLPELKMEICDYIDRTRGFRPKLDQILIAPDAKAILFTILLSIIKRGEEVVTTNPSAPTYARLTELLGAQIKYLPSKKGDKFKVNLSKLDQLLGKKTKTILLSSPHNPTGNVMTNLEVQELSEAAKKNKNIIISDETFNQIIFNGHHVSPATFDHAQEQTLIVENLSYTFSITGWQVSFCIGPKKIIEKMQSIIVDTLPLVPNFMQYASAEALRNYDKIVPEVLTKYKKCCETMVGGLNNISGFKCAKPQGTIYAFPEISKTGKTSSKLAEQLLESVGVAVLPGDIFGTSGRNHLRLSFATPIENINEGLTRLEESF